MTFTADRFIQSFTFFIRTWNSYKTPSVGLLSVNNSTGGLYLPLVAPWIVSRNQLRVILISEPADAATQTVSSLGDKGLLGSTNLEVTSLETELGIQWSSQHHEYDITVKNSMPRALHKAFDLIVSQGLLEHVVDPIAALDNLFVLRKNTHAVLAVQTCNRFMALHRFPIDTLRFFPDFFLEVGAARGLEVHVRENGSSIYAFFAEVFHPDEIRSLDGFFD